MLFERKANLSLSYTGIVAILFLPRTLRPNTFVPKTNYSVLGDGSLLRPENFMFQASVSRQKKEEEVLNLEQLERQAVERAMRLSEGNVTRAAEYLGITRFALYRKLEKLGL